MTDTQGNIDDATKAARDAADKVRVATADGAESFGATAEQITDDLSANAAQAKSEASSTVNDIADKVTEQVFARGHVHLPQPTGLRHGHAQSGHLDVFTSNASHK